MKKALFLALFIFAAAGCSDGDNHSGEDADDTAGDITDASDEGSPDIMPDTADLPPDAPDAPDGPDSADDPTPDPVPDTIEDAPTDSPEDAPPETSVPVIGGCPIFPADNMWNTPIDDAPLHENSGAYIASIGDAGLHPDFGTVWEDHPIGIPYNIVPDDQEMVSVTFDYADESDEGPYPIPADPLIEGGPDSDGDRHVLIIRQGSCILYEMFYAFPAGGGAWHAGSGAIWHLDENEERPLGWTSADAAGLAILPGLLRWEEIYEDGEINHAVRVTLDQIQRSYIRPASHSDGRCGDDPSCPPMGLRLRLKADYEIGSFAEPLQVILRALKKYGLVVTDTGGNMFATGTHDMRWDDELLHALHDVRTADFEAVYTGDIIPY